MVDQNTPVYDNEEWDMYRDPDESRLLVVIELKTPDGEWVEKEVSIFDEPGTYIMEKD